MGRYTEAERKKNQRTVSALGLGAVAVVLVGFIASGFALSRLLSLAVLTGIVVGLIWWLFASKNAGKIDGTWVDGWQGEDGGEWIGLPLPNPRSGAAAPSDSITANTVDAVPTDDEACPTCGLPFGAASGTSHVNCNPS